MRTLRTIFLLGIFTMLAFAQSNMEIKRPGLDADLGSATWVTTNCGIASYSANTTDGTLGRDAAGQTTNVIFGITTGTTAKETSRTFTTWATTTNTYTALTLNINSNGSANNGDVAGKACIVYSLDSGTTWTAIRCTTTVWAQTTDTITLSASQGLPQIMVGACVLGAHAGSGLVSKASVTIYDIWTSGTMASAAPGTGSGSGTSVQPVQFN